MDKNTTNTCSVFSKFISSTSNIEKSLKNRATHNTHRGVAIPGKTVLQPPKSTGARIPLSAVCFHHYFANELPKFFPGLATWEDAGLLRRYRLPLQKCSAAFISFWPHEKILCQPCKILFYLPCTHAAAHMPGTDPLSAGTGHGNPIHTGRYPWSCR